MVLAIKCSALESNAEENAYIGTALAIVVIISATFTYYQVSGLKWWSIGLMFGKSPVRIQKELSYLVYGLSTSM